MRLLQRSGAELQAPPRSPYQTPGEVLHDPDLASSEKREILAAWTSDRYAVPSKPWLREVPGLDRTLALAEILAALRKLDDEPPPRGGVGARIGIYRKTDATPTVGTRRPNSVPVELRTALIAAHQSNIDRYCRLLATELTELERAYVHRRIAEERRALDRLSDRLAAG